MSAISRLVYSASGKRSTRSVGPDFDDLAVGQHRDLIRDRCDQRQVVGDEQHRQTEVAPQFAEQLDDRRLDQHVECRRDLVADQHLGPADQRTGDRDALTFAARQLIGEAVGVAGGQATRARASRRPCGRARSSTRHRSIKRAGDRLADRAPGLQRAVRVLEHVLDSQPLGRRASRADGASRSEPSRISPVHSRCRPPIERDSVVLPEPDSPTSARHSPRSTCRSTLWTT